MVETSREKYLELSRADRFNEGKARLTLLSPYAQEGCARVLMFGAQKYAPWNWTKGLPTAETLDSLLRHVSAIQRGEVYDQESGLPHIDHIQCNAMFISHFLHTGRWDELSANLVVPRTNNDTRY